MQNKSLFESPPSLFVPNGQRLSSPSPTKDSSDAEFSSLSNPLHQVTKPRNHWQARLEAGRRAAAEATVVVAIAASTHSACVRGVGGVCVPLCAQLQWGRSRHCVSRPTPPLFNTTGPSPPQMVSSSLPGWKGAAEGGERRFSSSSQLLQLPSPLVPAPLRKPPPPPPLPPPTVKRQ